MYEKQHKSNIKKRIIAVILAVAVLAGSAFALTPTITKVSMPDPYGVMPLSLSSDSTARTVVLSGSYRYGYNDSGKYTSVSSATANFSYSADSYKSIVSSSSLSEYGYTYLYVSSGSYVDYVANVSIDNGVYSSVILSGGINFRLTNADGRSALYPSTAQFLVNGAVVGDSVSSSSSGVFSFGDVAVDLTAPVTSLGVRFVFSSTTSKEQKLSAQFYPSIACYVTDNVNYTLIEDTSLDYEPFFERVIAWEQSIYSGIVNLGNSLGESLGGVGESASKIASVFARDDDIQLRDDVDSTLQEVTTQFYDQTSTSSSSMTVETVQNVKGVADGVDALMSSGYSVSSAFTEIAENEDFMSWFTSETAQALDSTGAAAAVGDDDPYNMHYYYDHIAELEERRGD